MGDLGTSFRTREPVTKLIGQRVWPSLKLVFAAMAFAIAVGVTLGFIAALRPGSLVDTASMVGAISGLSLSQFWFGLMLMYLFALKLQLAAELRLRRRRPHATSSCRRSRWASGRWRCWRAPRAPPCSTC